jgi:hypothetical protein
VKPRRIADRERGERRVLRWVYRRDFTAFQADWIVMSPMGQRYLLEVKCQEPWEPDLQWPHYGYGLDPRQVTARLLFERDSGIPAVFVDKLSDEVYWQFFAELQHSDYHVSSRRGLRIYPREAFHRGVPLPDEAPYPYTDPGPMSFDEALGQYTRDPREVL